MPARIDRVPDLSEALRRLPELEGPADGWASVQARLRRRERRELHVRGLSRLAIAASVTVLAITAGLRLAEHEDRRTAVAPPGARAAASADAAALKSLREQSRALDAALAALPARPAVSRADTALPIDAFEAQVQWLDHEISLQAARAGAPQEAEALWRRRVELMSSLVQLRYVEAQTLLM